MTQPYLLNLADAHDAELVGGKAVNLSELIRAGLPVPDGFVITTAACRGGGRMPPELAGAIGRAYRELGSPPVAVRSSATAEDMPTASMAGQYETFLNVEGEQALLQAVARCWASLDSPRSRTYLGEHGIDISAVTMAVVVQQQVPADVAGVLFTVNPQTGLAGEMLVEASWGLGEAVVSGVVQPDRVRLDAGTGKVIEYRAADKRLWLRPGGCEAEAVEESKRREACLSESHLRGLWSLGRRTSQHFGGPQDIEWALAGGEVFVLQARPITALDQAGALSDLLAETRERLAGRLRDGRGPWVRHNIGETLPHPTPLTWSVIRGFMSGAGGFGETYRRAGYAPSPALADEGFLECIAGRVYMDVSVAGEMFFEGFPFRYDLDLLGRNPDAAQSPPTVPAGSIWARLAAGRRAAKANASLRRQAADLDRHLLEEAFPDFAAWCREQKSRELTELDGQEWAQLWNRRETRVMDELAPLSLLPTLIEAGAVAGLRAFLEEHFWDGDPDEWIRLISVCPKPDMTVRANIGLYEVAQGERTLAAWLADYGHRGPEEFDLAAPRWRERGDELTALAERLAGGADPKSVHERRWVESERRLDELRGRLGRRDRCQLARLVSLLRRYLRFREDGKHYLMLGYDLLRDLALDAGRRLGIGDDVFLLTKPELFEALAGGAAPAETLAERRRRRRAEGRITLPGLVDADALPSLGEAPPVAGGSRLSALSVSSGSAAGAARIVLSPVDAGELGSGYVLVCPSTDPSWTPLFVNAAAVVLERGGLLSHGAVVAREMGVPAVVLEGATRVLTDGETVTVDGTGGVVLREAQGPERPAAADEDDPRVSRELTPPVPGRRERAGARLVAAGVLVWGAYLAGAFVLPKAWLHGPTLRLLDAILWPLVPAVGMAGTVAIVAVAFAIIITVGQRVLTDNRRLRLAKRRAGLLRKAAAKLRGESPRRRAMAKLAAPVTGRILAAALVPIAVVLGPMMMTFFWFRERVHPNSWNAAPGSQITVQVEVDSDRCASVTIEASEGFQLDTATPAAQTAPPVRQTLEHLLVWMEEPDLARWPAQAREAAKQAELSPQEARDSLAAYLAAGVRPQVLTWTLRPEAHLQGRFGVKASAAGAAPLTVDVVLGDLHPPQRTLTKGEGASPLRSLAVNYGDRGRGRIFWAPFRPLGWTDWDAGWLLTYLLAYLPMMFALKLLLRLP